MKFYSLIPILTYPIYIGDKTWRTYLTQNCPNVKSCCKNLSSPDQSDSRHFFLSHWSLSNLHTRTTVCYMLLFKTYIFSRKVLYPPSNTHSLTAFSILPTFLSQPAAPRPLFCCICIMVGYTVNYSLSLRNSRIYSAEHWINTRLGFRLLLALLVFSAIA